MPPRKIIPLLICLLLAGQACTVIGLGSTPPTATPVPTSSVPGLSVTAPQACQVAEQGVIRVEQPQGNLLAWSPVIDSLAYIASTTDSSWNVGDLTLLAATDFNQPLRLAGQAAGQLSWSPEGGSLAFLTLRRSDQVYSVAIAYPGGASVKDLFPGDAAHTDTYSAKKSILGWIDMGRLSVLTSCGTDCMQRLDFGVLTGLSSPVGDPIDPTWDIWAVRTHHPATIPADYASLTGQLNWSPDESRIAYVDGNGSAWVINVQAGTIYPLDIGEYFSAAETAWSYDGRYLAVRADQLLLVFSLTCPK